MSAFEMDITTALKAMDPTEWPGDELDRYLWRKGNIDGHKTALELAYNPDTDLPLPHANGVIHEEGVIPHEDGDRICTVCLAYEGDLEIRAEQLAERARGVEFVIEWGLENRVPWTAWPTGDAKVIEGDIYRFSHGYDMSRPLLTSPEQVRQYLADHPFAEIIPDYRGVHRLLSAEEQDQITETVAEHADAAEAERDEQLFEVAVVEATRQELIRAEARERAKTIRAEREVIDFPLDAITRGDEFLAADLPEAKYLVEDLWPSDGNVLLTAQRKAGKTTVVLNLLRTLLDGDWFLDKFRSTRLNRVALIDFELGLKMSQDWLREQGIVNTANLTIAHLKGREKSFDLRQDRVRAWWAEQLKDIDVLILDPAKPLMDALGLDEWREAGTLLQAFDALKAEARIPHGLVVQHVGKSGDSARGDSTFEGWPDAIWRLTTDDPEDPNAWRNFSALGRDVAVERGTLVKEGRHLAYTEEQVDGPAGKHRNAIITALTKAGREMKTQELVDAIRGINSRGELSAAIAPLVEEGAVIARTGAQNAKFYSLPR